MTMKSVSDIFGIDVPTSIQVEVRDNDHAMIPREEPDYIFRKDLLSDILAWAKGAAGNDPLYLSGPTDSGKSSLGHANNRRVVYSPEYGKSPYWR